MTPTDKLRALLDERGIEHMDNDEEHVKETCWPYMGELTAAFAEYDNGTTRFACDTWCFTPEQAIAVTVGMGTCKLVDNDSGPDMHCTACGGEVDDEYRYFMDSWGYSRCPHCGARIIEEETE